MRYAKSGMTTYLYVSFCVHINCAPHIDEQFMAIAAVRRAIHMIAHRTRFLDPMFILDIYLSSEI